MADDANAFERRGERRLPVVQQIREHWVEVFFWRVPRLHEVVVEVNLVDRANGGLGVCICGKQHALGVGEELDSLRQELTPDMSGIR